MHRVPAGPNAPRLAGALAEEQQAHFGFTDLDGPWFVGQLDELVANRIGVVMPCLSLGGNASLKAERAKQ